MHPNDAERIARMGVNAIYVSNHGGRQRDAAPSAISALHQTQQRLGPQFPLVFDSGIRTGEDVVEALACGAHLVMLGQPVLCDLAEGSERGLQPWLSSLREELWVTLSQMGLSRIQNVGPHNLASVPFVQR